MQKALYCILLLSALSIRVWSQPLPQYIFSHLDTHDGLLSEELTDIVQDRKGFIWVGGVTGLQRYDGHRFISFRHDEHDPKSIPTNFVATLIQGDDDKLWLLFNHSQVGYIDENDLTYHEVPIRFDIKDWKFIPLLLFKNDEGAILLRALMPGGIYTYDKTKNEFSKKYVPFTMPAKWTVIDLSQDEFHNYWIAADSGLVKYNPVRKTLSYKDHNADNDEIIEAYSGYRNLAHPLLDHSGRFWLYSWAVKGPGPFLYSYDLKTKKIKEWEQEIYPLIKYRYHEIHHLSEQDDGTIWITGTSLFARLPKNENKFESIPNNDPGEFSIRYDEIRNAIEDKEKNIWVASDKGLFWFNPAAQLFQVINNRRPDRLDTIYTSDISDILQTKHGEILVNTWGNGLFTYDNKFNPIEVAYSKAGLKLNESLNWCVLQRSNGDIWRGSQDGTLFISKAGTNTTIGFNDTVFHRSTIRQIAEDKNGNLWLGTNNGAIIKWDAATNSFRRIFKFSLIFRLYIDKKGDVWACTEQHGVIHINPDTETIIHEYNSKIPGLKLMDPGANDIVQYDDSLYIIASAGLNLLNIKNNRIKTISADGELPSNSVNNLTMDRQGYLWLTTTSRLCRYSMKDSAMSIFNEEDGIPTGNFNVASSAMLADGRLAFGRSHDLIVFDPALIHTENMPAPGITLTGFSLMNMPLSLDSLQHLKTVQLKYNQNSISISFATLTYHNHFPLSYMMEGLDKDWIADNGTTEAIYNYLPPGDYTFKVKQTNNVTGAPEMATMKISVRAPFWKSWWFYSILSLLAAGLIYWEDRERVRRKEGIQKMRSEIAGNLHEEINITLNNINVLSEIARIKADKDPEQSKTYITEIHEKSHNMIIAMDDMLWSIDPHNDSMGKTIDRIKEFADALRNRHGVLINLQADEKVVSLKADMKTRYEVMIIYKLALRLLVEEMHSPQTSIQLDLHRSQLQLNIFAHYKKLPEKNNRIIQMMEEMKERASSINALLEFQSDEKGTAVILVVRS